eukprot:2815152-Karenia_brevis.AAC.2
MASTSVAHAPACNWFSKTNTVSHRHANPQHTCKYIKFDRRASGNGRGASKSDARDSFAHKGRPKDFRKQCPRQAPETSETHYKAIISMKDIIDPAPKEKPCTHLEVRLGEKANMAPTWIQEASI